jgi:hypothetical protein
VGAEDVAVGLGPLEIWPRCSGKERFGGSCRPVAIRALGRCCRSGGVGGYGDVTLVHGSECMAAGEMSEGEGGGT